jgi:hypothetical protein
LADWLIEEGIGEERAILVDGEHVLAARVLWPGSLTPGQVGDATLISRTKGASRGTVRFASGEEALADRLPKEASEGSILRVEVLRPRVEEGARSKLAQVRPTDKSLRAAPSLAEMLEAEGHTCRIERQFPSGMWEDVIGDAWSGLVEFTGGALQFSPTPAMTLVDVDGTLPPRELALAACEALGPAIARFGLGGSIGIDFPTLQAKDERKTVDTALGKCLSGWDHERTAMNGFGFVQLVARMQLPSILHRCQHQRTGAAARLLLRRAEAVSDPGSILLTAHPAVLSSLHEEWLDELGRRTGRQLRTEANPALALEAGFAQAVAS